MTSDCRITQISEGDAPAIHAYFDLAPESPNGEFVLYFSFLEGPPGSGQIKVATRDGRRQQAVGDPVYGSAHHAALQQWIDDDLVAYSLLTGDGPAGEMISISTGSRRRLSVGVRMFSPANGMGLCDISAARARGAEGGEEAVYLVDPRGGDARRLFTREEVFNVHPWRETFSGLEHVRFQNSKWSPDGNRFFTVYTNEAYLRRGRDGTRMKSLIVAEAADGYRPRYLAEFGHHPMWGHDSSFIYAHVRSTDGGQDLTAFPVDGGAPYLLAEDVPGVHATLSPDGGFLLTDAYGTPEPGTASLLLLDLSTGDARTLAIMNAADTSHETGCHPHPAWSRGGSRVYFNSNDTGAAHLYALDLG